MKKEDNTDWDEFTKYLGDSLKNIDLLIKDKKYDKTERKKQMIKQRILESLQKLEYEISSDFVNYLNS